VKGALSVEAEQVEGLKAGVDVSLASLTATTSRPASARERRSRTSLTCSVHHTHVRHLDVL
jgi:hypothetical protein